MAYPPCGPCTPVDAGGGTEGGAGHPAFEAEAPPLAAVGETSSP